MIAVVGLLAVGVLLARLASLPTGTVTALDWLVLRFSLPGLVLAVVPSLDLGADALVPVGVAWGTLVLLAGLVWAVARAASWSRQVTGTMLLVVPLGNTSFLGIPAVEALLGADHVPYAVVYDQLGSFLALATWGSFVAARFGHGAAPTVASTVRRVATFPPFVALVVALVVRAVGGLPDVVDDIAARAGATLVPLTMLSVGMRLRLPSGHHPLAPVAVGLGLRMVVAPAVVLGVAALAGATGDGATTAWTTSNLEAAMPPMVTASVVAAASGLDDWLGSTLVGVGILAAMVTLPAWAALLT